VTSGLGVRFGVPVSELDKIFVGVTSEHITINPGNLLPTAYQDYSTQFGASTHTVPLSVGWARDSRDNYLNPNSGRFMRLNTEYSGSGDVRYVRSGGQFQQYFPLSKQYTFAFNVDAAAGHGISGQPYPVFKNYYLGGLGSVRGFQPGTLGPVDPTGIYIGGNRKFTMNTEFLAPFPGAGNDRTLRLYGFYDAGNVFGQNQSWDFSQLRTSYGFGLSWVSPMGPLRLAWARPIRYQDGDKIEHLQFQIGTSF
jgi:outer membrane protein insertion porin family